MATPKSPTKERIYAAAHFALELDGKQEVGLFRSVEGGSIKTDVMTYQNGANYDRWRQLGKPKFEDVKVSVGMSMSEPFYKWIEEFFTGKGTRKTGAIVAADYNYTSRARREFSGALIKELSFPKLDATDKSPAYMNIAFAVEDIKFKPGDGKTLQFIDEPEKQKAWTACNFRLKLDTFASDTLLRVTKIDSFTIKQNIIEHHMGGFRAPIKCPSQIDYPSLTFYIPEIDAQPFLERFHAHGVMGAKPGGLTGAIECFDNDKSKNVLLTVSFSGAEISNVQPEKSDSNSEDVKLVKVEVFTESMSFTYHAVKGAS
ncbi:MAG TPA: phage tail protein [Kofleriaceae bacterium]|nr:phage tail protein [Kofleriaceae bacterium]